MEDLDMCGFAGEAKVGEGLRQSPGFGQIKVEQGAVKVEKKPGVQWGMGIGDWGLGDGHCLVVADHCLPIVSNRKSKIVNRKLAIYSYSCIIAASFGTSEIQEL
jgi:hypothetical protein